MNNETNHHGEAQMDNMTIAKTILNQIGGKALYMIGAKQNVAIESGVSIKVGRGAKHPTGGKVTHLRVTLDANDTYTFEVLRAKGGKNPSVKVLDTTEGVYCDMLREMIESSTGMYTSLF